MEEVSIQVQLTGRPYLTLKPAVAGRAVHQGWGRRVPLSCVPVGAITESQVYSLPKAWNSVLSLREPLLTWMDG